ncbi:MAG: chemotaxis protein CheD [bacterium]
MNDNTAGSVAEKVFLKPGYICLAKKETYFHGVTGAGIILTCWDKKNRYGGICYFIKPCPEKFEKPTPCHGLPAIKELMRLFREKGSSKDNLEIHMVGGAENPEMPHSKRGIANENIVAADKTLSELGLSASSIDTGGSRGRKVVFNSKTGEIITAKVNNIRMNDWYPENDSSSGRKNR